MLSFFLKLIKKKVLQAQIFTFLVRDQHLGVNMGSAQGPTWLGKYLMHSPMEKVIFRGETIYMCMLWYLSALCSPIN